MRCNGPEQAMRVCADDVLVVMGRRPGTSQGLEAANQTSGLGYTSRSSIALGDLQSRCAFPRTPSSAEVCDRCSRWHSSKAAWTGALLSFDTFI